MVQCCVLLGYLSCHLSVQLLSTAIAMTLRRGCVCRQCRRSTRWLPAHGPNSSTGWPWWSYSVACLCVCVCVCVCACVRVYGLPVVSYLPVCWPDVSDTLRTVHWVSTGYCPYSTNIRVFMSWHMNACTYCITLLFQHPSSTYFYKLAYADIPKENVGYSKVFHAGVASCLSVDS